MRSHFPAKSGQQIAYTGRTIMTKNKLPNATAPPLAPNITSPNVTDVPETENVIEIRARRMLK
jgi:hypothetical protein